MVTKFFFLKKGSGQLPARSQCSHLMNGFS